MEQRWRDLVKLKENAKKKYILKVKKNKKGETFHRAKKCGNNYKKISPEIKSKFKDRI